MDKKTRIRNIVFWVLGIALCGFGICLSTKADFGLSMISAPPYILHVFFSEKLGLEWYTQGRSEYIWEAFLLIVLCISIQRFRPRYLFSFAVAVIVGVLIDGYFVLLGGNGAYGTLPGRILAYASGTSITCLAIAFIFRTTFPGQVYELFVMEFAKRYGFSREKVKMAHDVAMLVISILFALLLTRSVKGLGAGTVITTLINAPLIALFGKLIDRVLPEKKEEKN